MIEKSTQRSLTRWEIADRISNKVRRMVEKRGEGIDEDFDEELMDAIDDVLEDYPSVINDEEEFAAKVVEEII